MANDRELPETLWRNQDIRVSELAEAFSSVMRSAASDSSTAKVDARSIGEEVAQILKVTGPSQPAGATQNASTTVDEPTQAATSLDTTSISSVSASTSGGQASGSDSIGKTIAETALDVVGSGLGIVSLVKGLFGLFGDSTPEAPPPFTRYSLPESIQIEAANPKGQFLGGLPQVNYAQGGKVRVSSFEGGGDAGDDPQVDSILTADNASSGPAVSAAGAAPSATNIHINVQAMDSRSFLDHSEDIARAVRQAMLNMHALNDLVSDY